MSLSLKHLANQNFPIILGLMDIIRPFINMEMLLSQTPMQGGQICVPINVILQFILDYVLDRLL